MTKAEKRVIRAAMRWFHSDHMQFYLDPDNLPGLWPDVASLAKACAALSKTRKRSKR